MLPMLLGNSDGGLKTIHLEYSKPVLYTLPRDGTYSKRVHWVSGNLKIGIKAFKRTLFGPSSNEPRLEVDRQQRVESPERTFFGWKLIRSRRSPQWWPSLIRNSPLHLQIAIRDRGFKFLFYLFYFSWFSFNLSKNLKVSNVGRHY